MEIDPESLPAEMAKVVADFEQSLREMEACIEQLTSLPLTEAHAVLNPLEKAKHDTASVYSIISLYWAYMKTRGLDPKEHGLPKELDRIKEAMSRAKAISDKALAPKLDVPAAKRFIRGGLWEAKDKDTTISNNINLKK